jgi:hypothetical protein
MALSAYFLSSLFARAYIEWNFWRLKHQSPLLELSSLQAEIDASLAAHHSRIGSSFTSRYELHEKRRLLDKDPPAVAQIATERDKLYQQHQQLNKEFIVQFEALQAKGGGTPEERMALENGVMFQLHKTFERFTELNAQVDDERERGHERTSAERARLERQLREM